MATNPVVKELYPFSTRDGESIPLDIIDPISLFSKSFPATGTVDFTLPTGFALGLLYSTEGCIFQMLTPVSMVEPLTDATEFTGTIIVPPTTILTVALVPGPCRVSQIANGAGHLYIQNIRKWTTLALAQQVSKK